VNGISNGHRDLRSRWVRYNDSENLGIRIGSIPVEDVFFGLELILLNLLFYLHFLKKDTFL
jgi:lycopene cyclase domain-containing protein